MKRVIQLVAFALCVGSVGLVAAQRSRERGPVVLDVVVLDAEGRPVVGLQQGDFRVREDGRDVSVSSFAAVTPASLAERGMGRSVVLLLDDVGLQHEWTVDTRELAERFLKQAGPLDSVSVVRFSNHSDEVAGDRNTMAMRIAEFFGGAKPFVAPDTYYDALRTVASVASNLDMARPRRTGIVWVGEPRFIDIPKPPLERYDIVWPHWAQTVAATSRANASVYVIHPAGAKLFDPDGIVLQTGGTVSNIRDFRAGVDRIWNELGYYYLFEYTPTRDQQDLHAIDVRVSRPGAKVRVRKSRG